jgi:hypothetical protein
MASDSQSRLAAQVVFALMVDGVDQSTDHERCTLLAFARRLAALRGGRCGDFHTHATADAGHSYFVPNRTLSTQEAAALGIEGPDDLFGGVVPHDFIATKAITHPLVDPDAPAVPGWNPQFAREVEECVLQGYTVFDIGDALRAGQRLLSRGPVRIKPVRASGSRGQSVAHNRSELDGALRAMDSQEIATHGLVLEEHLQELRTFSIGQVQAAGLTASYFGSQRATPNNKGSPVYGGSDLTIVRGGYDAVLALEPPPPIVLALQQAHRYDTAVRACYPGFYASRSNYDILLGRDATGDQRLAVLEQSWRVGGATGAELAGLERLQAQPQRQVVRASSVEVFGDGPEPPPGAMVHYRGTDPHVGPMIKYTLVDPE